MALPPLSLSVFLSAAKVALKTSIKNRSPITFVIGNESADLDSICSAITLAYLRSSTTSKETLYIPLSNIPYSDLSLRPELLPVLKRANLKLNDLITLSDIPSPTELRTHLPPENTNWILVDHNSLQGILGEIYSGRVRGCIDHHDEENAVPSGTGEEPRIVRKSGSCASLVVKYCREAWDALSNTQQELQELDREVAYLALAPILIDTTNLTSKSKVTDADVEAVRYLEGKIAAASEASVREVVDAREYFEELLKAKEDIGGLGLRDILRKDYKQWTEEDVVLGISSVVKNLRFLIEKAGGEGKFLEVVKEFAEERKLSICSIMTTSHGGGEFKRELFVWGLDRKGIESARKFEAEAGEKLGLKKWGEGSLDEDEGGQWRRCWWQGRVENSRKQVAPLLRSAVADAR